MPNSGDVGKSAALGQHHTDAGSADDAQRVIDFAVSRFGSVDILVNNAAVFPPRLSVEMTEAIWMKP
jgi:NAD(P)-dependent dehydrogenase (short-subunit alcohol dehydrogenase family)